MLTLTACKEGESLGKTKKDHEGAIPDYAIRDIYEFNNDDGACTGSELFGDSAAIGCLHYAQLVRFGDGSAYYSIVVGQTSSGLDWTYQGYIQAGTTTFTRTLKLGSNIKYQLNGDLSPDTPTLSINQDLDLDFSDTVPWAITLVETVQ